MEYLFISAGILVVLNIAVSIYIFKRDDLEQPQKIAQVIVVWLIPYIGAIGLWLFNRSQDIVNNKPSVGSFGGGHSTGTSNGSSGSD